MNVRFARLSAPALLVAFSFLAAALPAPARGHHAQVRVIREVKHDLSPALRDLALTPLPNWHPSDQGQSGGTASGGATSINLMPNLADPAAQQSLGPNVFTTAGLNFDGIPAWQGNLFGAPDANGAVGATQFVQAINTQFAVYDKTTGNLTGGPNQFQTLWKGFGGPCEKTDQGDVLANYDKMAGRWVFTHHASQNGSNLQCFAVSTTSDANGTYNRYAFQLSASNDFLSDSKLGIWPDAYYVATNELNPTTFAFISGMACALNRAAMVAGATATAQCFDVTTIPSLAKVKEMLPSDFDGTILPPTGTPNFFMNLGSAALNMFKFHVDFTTPSNSTFTGPTAIPVASYQKACPGGHGGCIPQMGSTQVLLSYSDRLMYRLAYRNFTDHDAIVVVHSVNPPTNAFAGIRWYEIRTPETTPIIFQQGTYSPDGLSRWMGSIAMDKLGDIAVGYSVSDSTIFPAVRYTGRQPSDTLGTLEGETSIIEGTGSQQPFNSNWGNYTSMSIDPADDCTFWYTNEYWATSDVNHWRTRIASFRFATCQ